MKIDGNHIQRLLGTYASQAGKANSAPGSAAARHDQVDLSEQASLILKVQQAYEALPELSNSHVADIQQKLRNGSYHVHDDLIAEAILREIRG